MRVSCNEQSARFCSLTGVLTRASLITEHAVQYRMQRPGWPPEEPLMGQPASDCQTYVALQPAAAGVVPAIQPRQKFRQAKSSAA